PNASTTKIMTAAIAIEAGKLGRTIKVSKHAADAEPANLVMKEGEKFTLKDLLYGMMIHSANDAAIAVSEGVGGTEQHFVDKMNEKAKSLGCDHTHFVTPNGLHDPDHYTTARDLATITEYALKIPFFNTLIKTRSYKLTRSMNTKNVMVHRSRSDTFLVKYDGADGVKTGYTHQAGNCYVGSATRPDAVGPWRLVSVVLHSTDKVNDTSNLMDYGFKAWGRKELAHPGQQEGSLEPIYKDQGKGGDAGTVPKVPFNAQDGITVVLRKDKPHTFDFHYHVLAQAPVSKGDRVGDFEVSVDGAKLKPVPLILSQPIPVPGRWKRAQGARWLFGGLALLSLGCSYGSFTKVNRRRRPLLSPRRGGVDPERTDRPQRSGRSDR
ncbi:MAG: D-alanyl-D-alanine carboxypeptidase, partial [Armatimonadota bacterium]|nr:D-alanyl-D-alanine carboxypeptidase [Armatimonadota bacterium]